MPFIYLQEYMYFQAVNWDLSPVTTNGWLNIYLQVANAENLRGGEHGFVFPQYSSHAFIQIARVRTCLIHSYRRPDLYFSTVHISFVF